MKVRLAYILLFVGGVIHSQTCESYNRKLFHMLPDTFPEKINCIDKDGKKQGWWINYKVQYNLTDRPDELAKGDYVQDYWYGEYKNNLKVGTWVKIANVHQVFPEQEDNYFYYKDSLFFTSIFWMWGSNNATTVFNKDSSVIISKIYSQINKKEQIRIECEKKECVMIHKGAVVKKFPINQFFIEYEKAFIVELRTPKE
jgi:hypothetical protein